ncbi:uncharacterized protein LOC100204302 isoform X1 [Hydra vulgaris]|uniref:Uncharacterized protein LOC100204302 isoform X1 n=1 Tax=Hydra vulgaris TaxID=6087 RepID=A0ABM4CTQ0_HYDVU
MWAFRLFFALLVFTDVTAEKTKSKGHASKLHAHHQNKTSSHTKKDASSYYYHTNEGKLVSQNSTSKRFSIPNKDDAIISNNIQSPEKITIIKKSGSLIGSELPGAYGGDEELTDIGDGSGEEVISGSGRSVADIMEAARDARKKILEKKKRRKKTMLGKEDFPGLPVKDLYNKSDSESVLNVDNDIVPDKTDQKNSVVVETKPLTDEPVTNKSSNDSISDGNEIFSTGETKLPSSDNKLTSAVDNKISVESNKEVNSKEISHEENYNEADKFGNNVFPKPGINPSFAFQTGETQISEAKPGTTNINKKSNSLKKKPKNLTKKINVKKIKSVVKKHNKNNRLSRYEISAKAIAISTLKKGYVEFLKSQTKKKEKDLKQSKKESTHNKVKHLSQEKRKSKVRVHKQKTNNDIVSQIQNIASQIDAVEKKNAEDKKLLEVLENQKKTSLEYESGEGSGNANSEVKAESVTKSSKSHKKKVRKIVSKIQHDIEEYKLKMMNNTPSTLAQHNKKKLFGQHDDKLNNNEDVMDNDTSSISHGENGSPDGFECPWVCFWTCHSYCPKECCHNPYGCHGICRTFCTPYCSDRCCAPGSRRLPKLELSFQTPAETGKSSSNKNKTLLEEKVEKQLQVLEENQKMVEQVEAVKQAESYAAELLGIPRDCPLFCNKICAPGLCAQDCCEKSTILSYLNHEKSLIDQAMQYKKQLSMLPRPQLDALLAQQDKYLESMVHINDPHFTGFSKINQANDNDLHPKASVLPTPSVTQTAQAAANYNQQTQIKPALQPAQPVQQSVQVQTYNNQVKQNPSSQQQTNLAPSNTPSSHLSQEPNQPPVTILIQTGSHPIASSHAESADVYTTGNKNPYYQSPLPNAVTIKQDSNISPGISTNALAPVSSFGGGRAQYLQQPISQQSSIYSPLNLHPIEPQHYVANEKTFRNSPPQISVKPPYPNVKAPSIANRLVQQQQQQQQQQIQKQRLLQQQRLNLQQKQQNNFQMQQAFYKPSTVDVNQGSQISGSSLSNYATPAPIGFHGISDFQSNSPLNSVSSHALNSPQEITLSQQIINFPPPSTLPSQVINSAPVAPVSSVEQLSAPVPAPAVAPAPAPASVSAPAPAPALPQTSKPKPQIIIENMKPFQIGGLLFTPDVTIADPSDPVPPGYQSTTIVPEPPAPAPANQVSSASFVSNMPSSLNAPAAPVASILPEAPSASSLEQVGTPFSLSNEVSSFCPTPINCPEGKTVDPDYCPPICRTSCIEQCPNECCPNYGHSVEQAK